MPEIYISLSHGLALDEVITRLKQLVRDLRSKFGKMVGEPKIEWTGPHVNFKIKVKGFVISGKLKVTKTHIRLEAQIPSVAGKYKDEIEARARVEIMASLA